MKTRSAVRRIVWSEAAGWPREEATPMRKSGRAPREEGRSGGFGPPRHVEMPKAQP
jgi:hypothetical protein